MQLIAVTRGQQEIIINNPQPMVNPVSPLLHLQAHLLLRERVGDRPLFGLFFRSIRNIGGHK